MTPLSRTTSTTSSVMSRTDSPPLVRSCVSCWKTFTVRTLLRCRRPRKRGQAYFEGSGRILEIEPTSGSVPVAAGGRPAVPGRPGVRVLGRRAPARAGAAADSHRPFHPEALVPVDRAIDLVRALFRERDLERPAAAGRDVGAFLFDAVALDFERVRRRAVVDALEDVRARLAERNGVRRELVLLLVNRDGLDDR